MKEHPIPQDITGYRFHIVGSMTLKQFGEVAAGVVIAFLIYNTSLIAILKWPLVALFGLGGAAAAFLPIGERPLSHWISTFVGLMYKPTQFFWKRSYNIPAPFLFKGNADQVVQLQEVDLSPARRQRIKEFISSTKAIELQEYTGDELSKMSSVLSLFSQEMHTQITTNTHSKEPEKPPLSIRVRSMRDMHPTDLSRLENTEHIAVNSLDSDTTIEDTYIIDDSQTMRTYSDRKSAFLEPSQVAQSLDLPEIETVNLDKKFLSDEDETLRNQQIYSGERAFSVQTAPESNPTQTTETALFNAALPFPTKPTVPNKLVGMILTPNNELIPGAIVEIKTLEGHVIRAVKTNALGQFFITTPLLNGQYVVTVEKGETVFTPLSITLNGTIVEPLEIRSS